MKPQQEKFLKLHLFDNKKYDEIAEILGVQKATLSQWWEELADERTIINRAKQYYNSRSGREDFKSIENEGSYAFYQWYKKQEKRCYYCGSEEYKLQAIFDDESGNINTKRGRGKILELERIDTDTNLYTYDNIALACYFCNNHKSDIINEKNFRKFFAKSIKDYIDEKYNELKQKQK